MTKIAIVNEHDEIIGAAERSEARAKGLRHRIARVFLVNRNGEALLHRRSELAIDTPGKWDQSAGGHVDEGEDYLTAARRETLEELGIEPTEFIEVGKFYIERQAPGGFVRRFQVVFITRWDDDVHFDPTEIAEVKWFTIPQISAWLQKSPDDFTKNFRKAFDLLHAKLQKSQ